MKKLTLKVYYFAALFNSENAPDDVRIFAENALGPLTFDPWINEWYKPRVVNVRKQPKPRMNMHPTLQLLISRLETDRPRHFISACLHLLDGGEETRTAIAEGIYSNSLFSAMCFKKVGNVDFCCTIFLKIYIINWQMYIINA